MRKIFVLGHSHLTALANSCKAVPPGPEMEFLLLNDPEFRPPLQGEALSPAIMARLRAAGADLHVAQVGGNDHSIAAMLNHPRRFDVVLPEAPDLPVDPAAELLPAGLVRAELERRIGGHVKVLAAYRAAVPGRLVHVESPPPIPSEAHIRRFPGVFRAKLDECGVSPALLRYKFWRLHSALYRAACARLGVEFISVPREMCDDAGMMIEAAWNNDPTHGNALYGAAVIRQLLHGVAA